mmetsp:Transcript_2778/g.4182  ORF Transcript_2778/g.4182 Transcript_2778/m.4182 type:complete len:928 (+) Transcript_2778:61-2844(+)
MSTEPSATSSSTPLSEPAQELKARGNSAYSEGDHEEAVRCFTEALSLCPDHEILLCNRSMAYAAMSEWDKSIEDAKQAVKLAPKYEKAYFRLVKALIQKERFKDARLYLTIGFNECGNSKHLRVLEQDILDATGIPVRPKPHDFDTIEELGDGNFSKIYKAEHKPTGKVYAVKTIEKMTVDRMKRRHTNIHNEILIEKRTLNKLDHPNIVTLYSTFQDYGTLYYQMEFLSGGEVWSHLQDSYSGSSVGCPLSLARFFIAEAINALEYMHRRGIVHRDVKPENMLLTADGHLKFVDFGTCKDLLQPDLNGQEFVGTAEYMSPEVVESKDSGPETDLWALGVVLYQMMTGYTTFLAASPYLSFLRIKRTFIRQPCFASQSTQSLISTLIQRNKKKRLQSAAALTQSSDEKVILSYDKLRQHPFFTDAKDFVFPNPYKPAPAVRVPRLGELALRAVGMAAKVAAEKISVNGGSRVGLDKWVQEFSLTRLPEHSRKGVLHYLNRRGEAHAPAVYRLFWSSVVDARCIRPDWTEKEILGFNRHTQGHWEKGFTFAYVTDPLFGRTDPVKCEAEQHNLRTAISAINKCRPRFVVIGGNFTSASPDIAAVASGSVDAHLTQTELFRRCAARVSETIPVLFVPGDHDCAENGIPTPESLERYRSRYGCDHFGFWYGGVRLLVINSTLMIHPERAPVQAAYQDTWLEEELEQCRMCAMHVVVFSHHRWFIDHADEDNCQDVAVKVMPKTLRDKWLPKMRHVKLKYVFAGGCVCDQSAVIAPYPKKIARIRDGSGANRDEDQVQMTTEALCVSDVSVTEASQECGSAISEGVESQDDTVERDWKELPPDMPEYSDTDSEKDGDEENKDKDETEEDDNGLFSPDTTYNGPELVITAPIGTASTDSGVQVFRLIDVVNEECMQQRAFSIDSIPTKLDRT